MTTLVLTWACHPSSVVQNSFLGFNSCHLWDPQPREGKFFVVGVGVCVFVCVCGGAGGVGASEERVISKFFTNWGGSNLFWGGPQFFWQGKITSCRLVDSCLLKTRSVYKPKTCIYKQSYQPRLI